MGTLSKGWRGWHGGYSRVSSISSGGRHFDLLVGSKFCKDFVKRDWSGVSKMLVGLKHIYIFLLHVFNEAFQLKAFLEDIMRLVFSLLVEIGSQFCPPEERHVALQLVVFLVFL